MAVRKKKKVTVTPSGAQERARAVSKKTGTGGLGQAAGKLRKQRSERQRALKELLGD